MSLIDREFLKTQHPGAKVLKLASPISVRRVGAGCHRTVKYAVVNLRFTGKKSNGQPAIAVVLREVHIVEDLKAQMLLGMDILGPEGFILDLPRRTATIVSCQDVSIPLTVTPQSPTRVSQTVQARTTILVEPGTTASIPVQCGGLPSDRDLLFEP